MIRIKASVLYIITSRVLYAHITTNIIVIIIAVVDVVHLENII